MSLRTPPRRTAPRARLADPYGTSTASPSAPTSARDAFWRVGYEATTLADLTAAMGISKPSLYNAFGDKEALFLTVLDRYADGYGIGLAAMDEEPDAQEAVRAFLVGVARALARPAGPPGCLRIGHTARAGDHEPAPPRPSSERD